MITRIKRRPWNLDDESGSSIVETAIIAPVFVTIVIWSAFFYDFVQLRLKVQETARYAAWEMTAYPLSNYVSGEHGEAFGVAAARVRERSMERYRSGHSDDLSGPRPRFTVDYTLDEVRLENSDVVLEDPGLTGSGLLPEGMESTAVALLDQVGDSRRWVLQRMGFNEKGMVTATASATVRHRLMPQRALQREQGGLFHEPMRRTSEYRIHARTVLVADAWTLHDGREVVPSRQTYPYYDNDDLGFYRQVERGHMLGLMEGDSVLGQLASTVDSIGDYVEDFLGIPNFTNAHLAAKSYQYADARDRMELDVDRGEQRTYHTLPAHDECSIPICAYADSKYFQTLKMRGTWYMGCPEAESSPTECRWGSR